MRKNKSIGISDRKTLANVYYGKEEKKIRNLLPSRPVYLHTQTEDVGPLPKSLDEIQKKLPDYSFTRVHQSFLVNNRYVRRLNKSTKTLYLVNDIEIPVSRALYDRANDRGYRSYDT